ncbi:MAG: leucine-rich repeat protein [Clostridia bacterium]|nr:leucine-rich repeat protein [Clostridia bacterium]
MRKTILSLILIFSIMASLISFIPITVNAASSGTCGDNLTWTLDDSGTLTISGIGDMENYTSVSSTPWYSNRSKIKTVVIDVGVTSIGDRAFYSFSITKVTIRNSVKRIGTSAFAYCYYLTDIELPNTIESIDEYAFYYCWDLTAVAIPDTVTHIGNYAFSYCESLTNIVIPNGVTNIEGGTLSYCENIDSITIGSGVENIADTAFYSCDKLRKITVNDNNQNYSSLDGVLFDKNKTILINYPIAKSDAAYKIPDSVKIIGSSAFSNCDNLVNVTFPEGLLEIRTNAFWACRNLSNFSLPESVTDIGVQAFANCHSLTDVEIPDSVTNIGRSAFFACYDLVNIKIGIGATNISGDVFDSCDKLKNINVNVNNENYCSIDGVLYDKNKRTLIRYGAGRSEQTYILPESVTDIGDYVFSYCDNLTYISMPSGVTRIGNNAFYHCGNLDNITIPNGVISIGDSAFASCSNITSIVIPDSVKSIGSYAFAWCGSLENITIGKSVVTIGNFAFVTCSNLEKVYISDIAAWCNIDFSGSASNPLCNDADFYLNNDIIDDITIPDNVTEIKDYTFYKCQNLKSIVLSENITNIGTYAFSNCSALEKIYITDLLAWFNIDFESITANPLCNGGDLIINDEILTNLVVPENATEIKDYVFYKCTSLKNITLSSKVTHIGTYAFYGCSNVVSINVPNTLIDVDKYAFYGCAKLKDIYYNGTEEQWGKILIASNNSPLDTATVHYPIFVNGISLNKTSVTIFVNNTETLIPTIFPSNATNKNIEWISSNEEVATVDNGVVTAIGKGEAVITAKTIDGGYETSCLVTVQKVFGNGIDANGIEWVLYDNGLLSITGKGAMPNYPTTSDIPWYSNRANVREIVISENITHIGDKTFYGCINVQKATIPNTVTTIGDNAFKNCDELTIYGETGTYAQTYAAKNEIPFVNTKTWDLNVDFIASSTKWYFDVIVEDFSGEAIVYVATYDSDDRMLDINSENFVVNDITSLSLAKKSDASYAKVFVWTSHLQPITLSKKIDL